MTRVTVPVDEDIGFYPAPKKKNGPLDGRALDDNLDVPTEPLTKPIDKS